MHHEINYLRSVIDRAEKAYLTIKDSLWLNTPKWSPELMQFRHKDLNEHVFIFLKGIRYFSLLNASFILLNHGHYQEMYILSRCMDEALEDAQLFLKRLGENDTFSVIQERVLNEFYLEEFDDYSVPSPNLVNVKRDRPSREKIGKAINAASPIAGAYPNLKGTVRLIYKTFSGYVHGAYVHIMELVGGEPLKYHTRGMQGTVKAFEAKDQFAVHVYRALIMGRLAAKRLGMGEQDEVFVKLQNEMEQHYPDIASIPKSYEQHSEA